MVAAVLLATVGVAKWATLWHPPAATAMIAGGFRDLGGWIGACEVGVSMALLFPRTRVATLWLVRVCSAGAMSWHAWKLLGPGGTAPCGCTGVLGTVWASSAPVIAAVLFTACWWASIPVPGRVGVSAARP